MDIKDYSIILPGRIVEYFPGNQTATIRISIERSYDSSDATGSLKERVLLKDVPVHTPYGGGWSITFPIKPDDTCLLLFSQVGYDHWMFEDLDAAGSSFGQDIYWTRRCFSVQDGFAFVGINTLPRAITSYSDIHSQWRNSSADQIISLDEGGDINITSPTKVVINAPDVTINSESATVNTDTATVAASASVDITSATISMTGAVSVTGTFRVSGASTLATVSAAAVTAASVGIAGVDFSSHIHYIGPTPTTPPS